MFACDAVEFHCIMQQEFIVPANFYTLLVDNRSTPKQNSTLKQKENPAKCSALLASVGSRHRKGMWYMGWSSFWRRALPWLWQPAVPAVCCGVEEMSAPRECMKRWGMLTLCHCVACGNYLRQWQIFSKKAPASLQWSHSSCTVRALPRISIWDC